MSAAEAIGPREFVLLNRARQGSAPHVVMTKEGDDTERLAAKRLVERGIFVRSFPAAGRYNVLRRFYQLTEHGRACPVILQPHPRCQP